MKPYLTITRQLPSSLATSTKSRADIDAVLNGTSDKLVVVVGPCSIHDPSTALEYAYLLRQLSRDPVISSNLVVVMRAYLEKPRTTVGWKGLLNDPDLDGSFNITKGLLISRQLFSDITSMGVPIATELLGILSPRYLAEFLSLGAIGARTVESQVHRELASGLNFPIGFKNGTDGGFAVAIDALESASSPHYFAGISKKGQATIVNTEGNDSSFLILRGGGGKTNYDAESVAKAKANLKKRGMRESVMIDCSHGK
jgi:3-deoxy-7-phosphoheptulonate synthase